jgi:hypothetical protein
MVRTISTIPARLIVFLLVWSITLQAQTHIGGGGTQGQGASLTTNSPQAFQGPITATQLGRVFQSDAAPTSCTYGGVTYTTQLNCAAAAAGDWVTTNGQNAMLAVSQGRWDICQAIQLPNPTNNGSLSIYGTAYGSTAATGVTIRQASGAGCNTTLPVISQALNTNSQTLFEQTIRGITIDANGITNCMEMLGGRRSEYDVNCNNAVGDHGVLISGPGGTQPTLGFEMRKSRIFVRTAAYGGSITYPTFTVGLTGGSVSSWTVVNAGSFPSTTPLTATIAPGSQCTTKPDPPTIQTSAPSGGLVTITGLTSGAGLGVACTAVYVQVYETPQLVHGIIINTTDSTYQDLITGGATSGSGIQILHGANLIEHAHAYAHNPVQVEDHGNNVYIYLECDSPGGYCLNLQGSNTQIFGMTNFWNAQVYAGAGDILLGNSISNNLIVGHTCQSSGVQNQGGYNEITTPTGPFLPNSLAAPPGLEMIGINQMCDGSGAFHTNYAVHSPVVFGGMNASQLTVYNDSSAGALLNIGSGAGTPNAWGVSGARIQGGLDNFGYHFAFGGSGKGWRVTVGGGTTTPMTNMGGTAIGVTPTGVPFVAVQTAIASAATIAPTGGGIVHITGTAAISTMTPPTGCTTASPDLACQITLWPDAVFTIATGGNFLNTSTAVVGRPMVCTYDPTPARWGCSY